VFAANAVPLKKIYHMYDNAGSKNISMADVIDLFSSKSEVNLPVKDAIYCYGMSKYTIPVEDLGKQGKL